MTTVIWSAPPADTPPQNVLGTCLSPHFQHVVNDARAWSAAALAQDSAHGPALIVDAVVGLLENAPNVVERCRTAAQRYGEHSGFVDQLAQRLHDGGHPEAALNILYDVCLSRDRLVLSELAVLALMSKGDLDRLLNTERTAIGNNLFATQAQNTGQFNHAPVAKKPIFIVTLARSGTAFMANTLARATNWPFFNPCSRTFPQSSVVYHDLLGSIRNRGTVIVSHLSITPENLDNLVRSGIEKVQVHVRDPRQATLSWMHYLDQRFEESEDEWLRYRGLLSLPETYRDWAEEEKLPWLTRHYFPKCLEWIEDWCDAAERTSAIEFRFGDYAEFRADQLGYMNGILEFFETGQTLTAADMPSREEKIVHYRNANPDEWRQRFTPEDIETMTAAIPETIARRFNWML